MPGVVGIPLVEDEHTAFRETRLVTSFTQSNGCKCWNQTVMIKPNMQFVGAFHFIVFSLRKYLERHIKQ